MSKPSSELNSPKSPARVLGILMILARSRQAVSLATLTAKMQMPKSTVLSLLRALEQAGYVNKVPAGYILDQEAFKLGTAIAEQAGEVTSIRSALRKLAKDTGETALFASLVPDQKVAVYDDVILSQSTLRFAVEVGEKRPLYCTAVGLALLAFQSEEFKSEYLSSLTIEPKSYGSIRNKKDVRTALKSVIKDGYVISSNNMVQGAGGIAVPIFDAAGQVSSVVACGYPCARGEKNFEQILEAVRTAGNEISVLIKHKKKSQD